MLEKSIDHFTYVCYNIDNKRKSNRKNLKGSEDIIKVYKESIDGLVSRRKGVSPMGDSKPQHFISFGLIGQSFQRKASIIH